MVALIFVTEYRALQFAVPGMARLIRPLFIASIIWGAHAAREWLVQIQTPEANIRADLLLIWPVLAVTSGWALFRAFRAMGLILVFLAAAAPLDTQKDD